MQTTLTSLDLLNRIKDEYSDHYRFRRASVFAWSPKDRTISYSTSKRVSENPVWSLLHEIGHAELEHQTYRDDLELLMMEVAAWKKAREIAEQYHLVIENEHIDECLDSYRDWLHMRSRCITCKTHAFQYDIVTYECHNCLTRWRVPASRMCMVRKTRIK